MPLLLRRSDWGGPATFALDDLPPGVSLSYEPIDFTSAIVPVILEAKADAPLAAKLTTPRLAPAGEFQSAERTAVDVSFCLGGNNVPYHTLDTNHIAVAVTEAAPFSIEVVEPKVPMVQNGSMQLKIVAKRAKGLHRGDQRLSGDGAAERRHQRPDDDCRECK